MLFPNLSTPLIVTLAVVSPGGVKGTLSQAPVGAP